MNGPARDSSSAIRLAIVDGRALVASSLQALMDSREDSGIVTVYAGDDISAALASDPQVVLIDVEAAHRRGSLDRDTAKVGSCALVLFGSGRDLEAVRRGMRAGAMGYVSSSATYEELRDTIVQAAAGETTLTPQLATILGAADGPPALSERERQALSLYVQGMKLSAVATALGVSPHTAREYLDRVRDKYARQGRVVRTRTELYAAALKDGLLGSS